MKKKRQGPTSNSFLFVLIISIHFSAFGETIVWGQLSKDVTLPCLFTPGEDETIHWYLANNDNVHSYYNEKDQLTLQDSRYKGRTALFASEVNKGNASLQIHNLQMSDENRYNCYVATKKKKEEFPVTLHVAVFEEQSIESNNIQLKCYVKNFFPNDSISIKWEPNNENINNSDVSESNFTATNTNIAQCFIHHSVLNVTWRGSWEKEELNVTEQSNIKFDCKSCKSLKTNFKVTWSFKNDSLEIELAALNSSSNILSVIEKYENRIKRTLGEISLELKDLNKEDTGEYVCIVRSADSMHINVTLLNIIPAEEINSSLGNNILIPVCTVIAVIAVMTAILLAVKYCRRRTTTDHGTRQFWRSSII